MNYHLFVVNEVSLKYHIEYGFVGTGNSSNDFNISLWKDIARLQIGDKIVFYVQEIKKFYGFFKVSSLPFYDDKHYLQPKILPFLGKDENIKLQYRALIVPDVVFSNGIDEFDLIDILPGNVTDILWSILYRKLKGGRGCSPLFENEFNIIYNEILQVNNILLPNNNNSFTFINSQIVINNVNNQYLGQGLDPDIRNIILNHSHIEDHMHALLIKNLPTLVFNNTQWLGNEVYSGAGTQAIDILTIDINNVFNIVEVKRDETPLNTTLQVFKYIQWLQNRFQNFIPNNFQPIIIGYKINGNIKQQRRTEEFMRFNTISNALPLKYFEYEISNNIIILNEINYINWQIIVQATI
jgi:hypothetical protein